MTQTTFVEQVIEVASRLTDCVNKMRDAYAEMPKVIASEHEAIEAREYGLVTDACRVKEELGDRIEGAYTNFTLTGEKLAKILSAHWPEKPRPVTLSQFNDALTELANSLSSEQFAVQVLQHVAKVFTKAVQDFFAVYMDVKPQIEANRYLVTKLMWNYQESYRFWQEVSEQVAVSYNAHGVQKAAGRNSGFRVKA
ncbi:MAG: hypothetical protein FJ146_05935 [Deltaproteobacteria bacterium]|nr:hypothetical protein [Deltaproteobacteria bacterium]